MKGRILLTVLLTVVVTLLALWLSLVAVARSGAINVASTADELPGAEWFFSTLSEESIRRHAEAAAEAGDLVVATDVGTATLEHGASHYRAICVVCHGAPGVPRGELGDGMTPQPPDLSHTARDMSEEEILWVLHHGIRHTGMPAFGRNHSGAELRALAALVARFDEISPEEFARLARAAPAGGSHATEQGGHDNHRHQPGAGEREPAGDLPTDGGDHEHEHEHDGHEHSTGRAGG